jgi:C4-dicarboxylate transporter
MAKEIDNEILRLTSEVKELKSHTEATIKNKDSVWWSTTDAMTMSASVLLFGVAVIFTIAYLIQKGCKVDLLLKVFGTLLIIIMSIFLVVAGYSDQQIAPVMGLLGTIAGYLLGKESIEKEESSEK